MKFASELDALKVTKPVGLLVAGFRSSIGERSQNILVQPKPDLEQISYKNKKAAIAGGLWGDGQNPPIQPDWLLANNLYHTNTRT